MSIYNPLSSSYNPTTFLSYELFQVTESLITGSSERTPTSSATLYSGSTFILSASAAFTAGLNIQTPTHLISYIYQGVSLEKFKVISFSLKSLRMITVANLAEY